MFIKIQSLRKKLLFCSRCVSSDVFWGFRSIQRISIETLLICLFIINDHKIKVLHNWNLKLCKSCQSHNINNNSNNFGVHTHTHTHTHMNVVAGKTTFKNKSFQKLKLFCGSHESTHKDQKRENILLPWL